jgi:alkylhydroperoxidase family enzyme
VRFAGAKQEGLGEASVAKIRDDFAASDLEPRQKAVLAWTDAFLGDAGASEELQRDVLAHFTPAQIVELAAANAIFMGFSKIALTLGDVPDDLPLTEQATPDVAEEAR